MEVLDRETKTVWGCCSRNILQWSANKACTKESRGSKTRKLRNREAIHDVNRGCVQVFKARAEPRWLTSRRREPVEESKPHVTQQRLFWQDCHWSFWRHQPSAYK